MTGRVISWGHRGDARANIWLMVRKLPGRVGLHLRVTQGQIKHCETLVSPLTEPSLRKLTKPICWTVKHSVEFIQLLICTVKKYKSSPQLGEDGTTCCCSEDKHDLSIEC